MDKGPDKLYFNLEENKGKVWFDNIRLLEGNALIKTSTTTTEMLLPRMMKKDRRIHSHMTHQEIKRAKQMKKEIQNYMITTKIIYRGNIKEWYLCKLSLR